MTTSLSGGCACGAIRYECAKPLMMFLCHCRDCQRASGAAYVPVVVVPAKGFKITKGEPTFYASERLEGGKNIRGFCPTCGSRLFGAGNNRIQGITAASFDDSSWYMPTAHIFTSQAQPWDCMDTQLPMAELGFPKS